MIKFVMCVRRNPALSREEFSAYWRDHHGPLFRQYAHVYRAVRYVQSHTLDTPLNANQQALRGTQPAFDGVGEIWWESEADFLAAVQSPEVQKLRQMFVEDEARFVDLANSSVFFTEEHVVIEG